MFVYLFTGVLEPDDSKPTRERRRICNEDALQFSLSSGRYPEYLALRDHRIAIIHRHVIVWIFYFYCGPSPSVI